MKKCLILNDTSYDFHHGCEIVMSNIIRLLKKNTLEVIVTNPVGVSWRDNKAFINKMRDVDIIIVNGEGTLHHNSTQVKELASIAQYTKENLNIPIVIINTTYQDNGVEIAEYMKFFDLIFVRESMSQNDLKEFGIQSHVVPDMTFYTEFNLSEKVNDKTIGATDSVYKDVSQSLYRLVIEKNYNYLPALTTPSIKSLNKISILTTIKFYLRKTVKYLEWKFLKKFDIDFIGTLHYIENYETYIQKIANLDFIYIGRYHSVCFALKTLTPFVAIKSNSHKIESMLQDIGLDQDRVVHHNNLNNVKHKPFTKEEELKIQKYITTAPIKIENMFKEIKKLVD